jgi:hypothetical protein
VSHRAGDLAQGREHEADDRLHVELGGAHEHVLVLREDRVVALGGDELVELLDLGELGVAGIGAEYRVDLLLHAVECGEARVRVVPLRLRDLALDRRHRVRVHGDDRDVHGVRGRLAHVAHEVGLLPRDGDAELGEGLLDDRLVWLEGTGHRHGDVEAIGVARLGQQRLGLLDVERVLRVERLHVARRAGREQLGGDEALALRDRLLDALAVEGVVERLAHLHVAEGRAHVARAIGEVQTGPGGEAPGDLPVVLLGQVRTGLIGVDEIELLGLHGVEHGGGVAERSDLQRVEGEGVGVPVILDLVEGVLAAGNTRVAERVWAGADRGLGERARVDGARGCEVAAAEAEEIEHRVVALRQLELDRVVVDLRDLRDIEVGLAGRSAVLEMLQAGDDRVGVDRGAVGECRVGADVEGDGLEVVGHLPRCGDARLRLAVLVGGHERVVHRRQVRAVESEIGAGRIPVGDVQEVADAQR